MPPYITNSGKIFERVSSGSFPINESSKLSHLYNKKSDQLLRVRQKIELEKPVLDTNAPGNLCAYLDLGFAVTCSEETDLQNHFYDMDLEPIADFLRQSSNDFSISRMGHSYIISVGHLSVTDGNGREIMANAGIHNFIEIMYDGSVRGRVILTATPGNSNVDIAHILLVIATYRELYSRLMGENFHKIFICAQKYEKLTVLKQFVPYFNPQTFGGTDDAYQFSAQLSSHQLKYGNNLIIDSERVPRNDYLLIDKRLFDSHNIKYNLENLVYELFFSNYSRLGYIDQIKDFQDN